MTDLILSLACLYTLVVVGFFWKKYLSPNISERDLSLLSVYFLAPALAFWGFSSSPLTIDVFWAAFYYLLLVLLLLVLLLGTSFFLRFNIEERAVFSMTNILANTGNLGIPIGLAFWGQESLLYTSAINLVSIFLSFGLGVYFYSRGNFSMAESCKNIFKLPVIWCALIAIILNLAAIDFAGPINNFLEIFGHLSIGFQLIILGVFLATHLVFSKPEKLLLGTLFTKFLIFPIMALLLILFLNLEGMLANILFLQSLMPAAVNNLNLASVYHCQPQKVTIIVFWTSLLSVFIIPLWIIIFQYLIFA